MADEYMDKLPVTPRHRYRKSRTGLQPFMEAGVDRRIVPDVPVTEPLIGDARRLVEAWASHSRHLINESKTFGTELES